jgi:hypothetical protein
VDILWDAAEGNNDGAGFAFSRPDGVEFHKGYNTVDDKEWGDFINDLELAEGKPTLIHFRWATPFIATPKSPLKLDGVTPQIIMHNGVYHDCYEDLKKAVLGGGMKMLDGPISDSRVLAALIGRYGWNITEVLSGLKGDKVALLRANGKCEFFGPWTEHKEGQFWYSNTSQFSVYSTKKKRHKVDPDQLSEEHWQSLAETMRREDRDKANRLEIGVIDVKPEDTAASLPVVPQQTVPVTAINEVTKEAVQVGLYKITKEGWKFTPAGAED